MRALGNLLITLSLVVGALAAATAYLVSLNLSDEQLTGLRLGAPAGAYSPTDPANADLHRRVRAMQSAIDEERALAAPKPLLPVESVTVDLPAVPSVETAPAGEAVIAARERLVPIGRTNDPLTPELIEVLRDAGVKWVKAKEFSFSRWPYGWVFGMACVGLLIGAGLVRTAGKRAVQSATGLGAGAAAGTPLAAAEACRRAVTELRRDLAGLGTDDARLEAVVRRLGDLQTGPMAEFVALRPTIVGERGVGGFASIMDRFAAAERQVNRAWSAAADCVLTEAIECLADAEALFDEAVSRLGK